MAGGLHELKPAAYADAPATLSFALALIASEARTRKNVVMWCLTRDAMREWGSPYAPGLLSLGLDPGLFLIVETRNAADAAFALEEGLKSRALLAALGHAEIKMPLMARRLGHAAKETRTPCFLISRHGRGNLPGTLTRWRIAASPSGEAPFAKEAPGALRWQLTLERCPGAPPERSFLMEFDLDFGHLGSGHLRSGHGAYPLRVVSPLAGRAVDADASQREQAARSG